MATKKGHVQIVLDVVDKGLRKGMTGLTRAMNAAKRAIVPVTLAVGALTIATKKAVDAANVQILAEKKLDHILITLNGATKQQAESLKALAAARQKVTTFGDEETIAAQATLATYKLSTETIKRLTPTIQDMSTALGVDLKSATDLVGRAMTGYASLLSRYGIVLDETTKKILANGTETEKLEVLNKALESRYKGLSEAMAGTFAGRVTQLKNKFGDVAETLGKKLIPQLEEFVSMLDSFLESNADKVSKWSSEFIGTVGRVIIKLWDMRDAIIAVGVAFTGLWLITKGIAIATGAYTLAVTALGIAVSGAVGYIMAFASFSAGLLASMLALAAPIAVIAAGITAVGTALWFALKAYQAINEVERTGKTQFKSGEATAKRLKNMRALEREFKKPFWQIKQEKLGPFSEPKLPTPPTGGGGVGKAAEIDPAIAAAQAEQLRQASMLEDQQTLLNEQLGKTFLAHEAINESLKATAELNKILAESSDALHAERINAMTETWIGANTTMAEVTRNTIGAAVNEVGSGIAREIVDGTNDWNAALKNVVKTMAAMVIKMLAMAAILTTIKLIMAGLTGGGTGVLGGVLSNVLPVSHEGTSNFPKGTKMRRYHSGGILRGNERAAILEGGEGVVNKRGMNQPGARGVVDALNNGGAVSGGGNNYYTIYANDAASFADQMRRNGYQVMEDDINDGHFLNGVFQPA